MFENRYRVSKDRLTEWARHPINKKRFVLFKLFWAAMLLLTSGIAVYSFMAASIFYTCFGVLLALYCAYRLLFRDRVVLNKQFKLMAQAHGAAEWERIVCFADKVVAKDADTSAEYTYDQFNALVGDGEYLALRMGSGWKALYLRLSRNGFGNRTFWEFAEFLRREHPHIEILVGS